MKKTYIRLILGGFVATIVLTIIVYVVSLMIGLKIDLVAAITNHISPNVPGSDIANSFGFGAGDKINSGTHMVVGSQVARYLADHKNMAIIAYFILGSFILPAIYALFIKILPQNKWLKHGWAKGLLFGFALWLLCAVILIPLVIPMLGYGFLVPVFGNFKTMFVLFLGKLGYGATLGQIACDKIKLKK